jgi:hypothetical protein
MDKRMYRLASAANLDLYALGTDKAKWDMRLTAYTKMVVKECLDVMSKEAKEAEERFTYMGDDVPTTVHQSNIMKHFGVEE